MNLRTEHGGKYTQLIVEFDLEVWHASWNLSSTAGRLVIRSKYWWWSKASVNHEAYQQSSLDFGLEARRDASFNLSSTAR